MPDVQHYKIKPTIPYYAPKPGVKSDYAELQVTSNFSFLRGGSHPEEFIARASELGLRAIALTDLNTLSGIVRAHTAAKDVGIQFIVGTSIELFYESILPPSGTSEPHHPAFSLLVYPTDRIGYGNLCRLLTIGKRRASKGGCFLTVKDFLDNQSNLVTILVPPWFQSGFSNDPFTFENETYVNFLEFAKSIKAGFEKENLLYISLTMNYEGGSRRKLRSIVQIGEHLNIPFVATNDVHYHIPTRKPLQDVLTCIRHKCTIFDGGFRLFQNSERFLKDALEMKKIFGEFPSSIENTVKIAERVSSFSLDELRYEYPDEICPKDTPPFEYLSKLVFLGASKKYLAGIPDKVKNLIQEELSLIKELQYEKYFLTCYDIVKFAKERGILCQGRGAAANSAICYVLDITSVDPTKIDLLFARFVSKEREEPPDIDIDFEHERREEVIQYIYQKYGRERAGIVAEVVTYRERLAIREVGKVLGLSLESVDKLAKSAHRWTNFKIGNDELKALGFDPSSLAIKNTLSLSHELLGFPRHLSQHVGGFIISKGPLSETVPILNASMENRTIVEWDKDDIEALGMLKIDVLGLGMPSCIRKTLELLNKKPSVENKEPLELHTIPSEDPKVYDMICKGDTIGVFQIESRAQISMLPRLKPRSFYDLVIEVAIVRPGPIHGNMVHPYLKRRNGLEPVNFPDEKVKNILGKTLGVPIFQEQAMRLAIALAHFTPGEAEKLRRAMAAWKKNKGLIETFQKRILDGIMQSGYTKEFAQTCINQLKGFSEYGFPESHAASFALLVYASAWLKCHHPAEFTVALLNSQPMGFYAPSQIIRDVASHGVEIQPVDVNKSGWDSSIEGESAVRLGMRLVKGLQKSQAELIVKTIEDHGEFTSIKNLWEKGRFGNIRLRKFTLQALAKADAFNSLGLKRREAFWEIRALPEEPLPLDQFELQTKAEIPLPLETKGEALFKDYESLGFSLKGHPIALIRSKLDLLMASTAKSLKGSKNTLVSVAGIGIIRQRPHTAKGVVFVTLEDETGIANLIIKPTIFERYREVILSSSCILAHGILERTGEVIYINAKKLESLDHYVLAAKMDFLPGVINSG